MHNAITEEIQLSLISANSFNIQLCPGSLLGFTDCFYEVLLVCC